MTNKQLDNRVKRLHGIEAQMKELETQAEAIRAELKADLEAKGEDEHDTGSFVIRWKEIISRRLDSKAQGRAAGRVHCLQPGEHFPPLHNRMNAKRPPMGRNHRGPE